MEPRKRIAKARIKLLLRHPFFGSIAMHMNPREVTPELLKTTGIQTMAVDIYGNLFYYPPWVQQQNDQTLMTALAHEVMHIALKHLSRLGSRQPRVWNIATDAAINGILSDSLPMPHEWVNIPKMKGKSAEEIYDWLIKDAKRINSYGISWDSHIFGKPDKNGNGGSPHQLPGQIPIDVPRVIREAYNFAKQRGTMPASLERMFADILNPVMDWKEILRRYIVSVVPHDFTYARPSKKAYATGFYMPRVVRENIDIVIGVDSSGSISDEEYTEFLSEIYAMTRQFDSLRATVLVCDAKIQEVVEINENFDPTMIHGTGRGGTSCLPVYEWIKENKSDNIKLLIYFTDGWIDTPAEEKPFHTLWVVTPNGSTEFSKNMPNQTTIQMPKRTKRDDGW